MRKLVFILVGLVLFFVAAAAVIPFIVDVDKYRPQIVQVANEHLNGKLELGKLKLSLWGRIRVEVGGVALKDSTGAKVLSVSDAWLNVPFASLFGGSPVLTFQMVKPEISVVKSKAGKLNVLSLIPETPESKGAPAGAAGPGSQAAAPAPTTPATAAKPAPAKSPLVLPGFAARARLSVELLDSSVGYRDEATQLTSKIEKLNFMARDISLSRPMELELWADLNTTLGKTFSVKGPFRVKGRAEPHLKGAEMEKVSLSFRVDLDGLEMASGDLFHKQAGLATNMEFSGSFSPRELKVDRMNAKFFNAEVQSTGQVSNFGGASAPEVQLTLKTNDVDLKPWVQLVPMLKEFELGGSVRLDAGARGPTDHLTYQAKMGISGVTAKAPKLKAQPVVNGTVNIITDQVESLALTMRAPGNDLQVRGSVRSFTAPRVDLEVKSSGMNLDQLVEWPAKKVAAAPAKGEPAPAAPAAPAGGTVSQGKAPQAAVADFDALLAPLRDSPIARAATANVHVSLASLKAYEVKMTDVEAQMTLKDLAVTLSKFDMKLFEGTVRANALVQLAPKTPAYKFSSQVSGLNLTEAVASQFAMFKNTLTGKANFDMAGDGASFNPDPAIANLKAKGSMKVANATFRTIDVGKMAGEGINGAIDKIGEKIPPLKGKKIGGALNKEFRYEMVSSDFTIAGGKFSAPNFIAKAAPNQGIDLKGATTVGMKDLSLDTRWEVIDTWNLLKAKDLAVEQQGVRVEHILAEGDGPVRFPVHAGCTIVAPCYSYTEVPEFLGKVALANVSASLTGKAKAELKKKVLEKAPAPIQKKLEELGKKFKLFGN